MGLRAGSASVPTISSSSCVYDKTALLLPMTQLSMCLRRASMANSLTELDRPSWCKPSMMTAGGNMPPLQKEDGNDALEAKKSMKRYA